VMPILRYTRSLRSQLEVLGKYLRDE
jgi:hypothetical protein